MEPKKRKIVRTDLHELRDKMKRANENAKFEKLMMEHFVDLLGKRGRVLESQFIPIPEHDLYTFRIDKKNNRLEKVEKF